MDLLQAITEALEKEDEKEYSIENNGIEIENIGQAEYYIKKYKDLVSQKEQIDAAAKQKLEEYKAKIERWSESCLKPIDNELNFIENMLNEWAKNNLPSNKKTIKLIEGTLSFKKQQDSWTYPEDEKLFVESLKALGLNDMIIVKESPGKALIKEKATIKGTDVYVEGHKIPGIIVEKREEKFSIK